MNEFLDGYSNSCKLTGIDFMVDFPVKTPKSIVEHLKVEIHVDLGMPFTLAYISNGSTLV